jgi:UPF0271 protein
MDLNCDLGESFGLYRLGNDETLLSIVTSANIACGLHAGDPLVMQRTVRMAVSKGVAIGAHPGYPDLQGFGRREMNLSAEEVEAFVLYQIGALMGFIRAEGGELVHVKPHGALYNQAAKDRVLARAIVQAVKRFSRQLIVVGLAGSVLVEEAREAGLPASAEGFPDRAYNPDGTLKPRREPGAVLETVDAVCQQAIRLATRGAGDGAQRVPVDTLCIHGDGAHAVEFATAVRNALQKAGISLQPLKP